MKTITAVLLAGLVALSACKPEEVVGPKGDTGAQGPKGDTGAQGPQGQPGTANAWSYVYANQQVGAPGEPEYNSLTKLYTLQGFKDFTPEKYAQVAENGAVLVYLRDALNAWTLNSIQFRILGPVPTDPASVIESVVRPLPDKIRVMPKLTSPYGSKQSLLNYRFDVKIILIAPTSTALNALRAGRLNASNALAVEQSLNLQ